MASTVLQITHFPSHCTAQARHNRPIEASHVLARPIVPGFHLPALTHYTSYGCNLSQTKFWRSASSPKSIGVMASAEFANKEASKFREDLVVEFAKDQSIADVKGRIADVCAKELRKSLESYTGAFSPEPYENMRAALEEQGLPSDKALRCALFWTRANLRRDWENWAALKR